MIDDLLLSELRLTESPEHDPFHLMPVEFDAHPRVMLTRADVERTRANRQSKPWVRSGYDRLLKDCDELPVLPEALPQVTDITVNQAVLHHARVHALAFLLTDEPAHREQSLAAMRLLARDYQKLPLKSGGSRLGTASLGESRCCMALAQAYDMLAATGLSEADDRSFRTMLEATDEVLDLIGHRTCGNHHTWQLAARIAVAAALGDRKRVHDALYGFFSGGHWHYGIIHQLRHDFLADGMHWERSMGYHYYTLMAMTEIAMTAANIGIDLWHVELPSTQQSEGDDVHAAYGPDTGLKRMKSLYDVPLFATFPNGDLPLLHDSGLTNVRGIWIWGIPYAAAFDAFGDPLYAWLLQRMEQEARDEDRQFGDAPMSLQTHHGIFDFARVREPLPAAPADTWRLDRDRELSLAGRLEAGQTLLPAFGGAMLRSDEMDVQAPAAYLYFGRHAAGHQNPAGLHADLYHAGRVVTAVPSAKGYGDRLYPSWIRTTIAHNTVCLDEQPMFPYDLPTESIWEAENWHGLTSEGESMLFQPDNGFHATRARNQHVYHGSMLDRTLVVTRDYVLDVFRVISRQERTADWAMHLHGEVSSERPNHAATISQARGYDMFQDVRQVESQDKPITLMWREAQVRTGLQLVRPSDASIYLVRHPHEEAKNYGQLEAREPATAVIARTRGREVAFVALWTFGEAEPRPVIVDVEGEAKGVLWVGVAHGSRKVTWRLPWQRQTVMRAIQ